jgi:hypothetical protein
MTTPDPTLAATFDTWATVDAPPPDPIVVQHRGEQPTCWNCRDLPPDKIAGECRRKTLARAAFEERAGAVRKGVATAIALRIGARVTWDTGKGLVIDGHQLRAVVTLHGACDSVTTYRPGMRLRVELGGGGMHSKRFPEPKAGFKYDAIAEAALARLWSDQWDAYLQREREAAQRRGTDLAERFGAALGALGCDSAYASTQYQGSQSWSLSIRGLSETDLEALLARLEGQVG